MHKWVQTCSSQYFPTSKVAGKARFTSPLSVASLLPSTHHWVPGGNVTTIDLRIVVRAHPIKTLVGGWALLLWNIWQLIGKKTSQYMEIHKIPYINHVFPYINHIFPYINHVFLYINHIFPYINHVFPYINHIFPYINHVFPYINHIFPYINHVFPYINHIFMINPY